MEQNSLSIADRWMRRYEEEHPEVLRKGYLESQQDRLIGLENLQQGNTPSLPSKMGGNACLWNTTEGCVDTNVPNQSIEPVVLAAIDIRRSLKMTQAKFARCLGISPRTIGEWEQGRRCPSGAAKTLLYWVVKQPDFLKEFNRSL